MRRLLLAIGLAGALAALGGGVALADGGPHGEMANPVDANGNTLSLTALNGNYTANTDHCAGCHRPHTAQSQGDLLRMSSVYALCTDCHNGTGSVLDVLDGKRLANRASSPPGLGATGLDLNGGGFVNFKATPVTSKHTVNLDVAEAWGAGTAAPGTLGFFDTSNGAPSTLDCASCHDPHGSPNYRLLRDNIAGRNVDVLAFAPTTQTGAAGSAVLTRDDYGRGLDPDVNGTPPPANKYTVAYYGSQNLTEGLTLPAGSPSQYVDQNLNTVGGPVAGGLGLNGSGTPVAYYDDAGTPVTSGIGRGGYFGAVSPATTLLRDSLVTAGASANGAPVGVALVCGACHTAYPSSDAARGDYDVSTTDVDPAYAAAVAGGTPTPAYRHRTEMNYDMGPNAGVAWNPAAGWSYSGTGTGPYQVSSVQLRLASDAVWTNGGPGNTTLGAGTPVPGNGVGDQLYVTCLTCHNAHGSSANMVGFASPTFWTSQNKPAPSAAQTSDLYGVNAQGTPVALNATPGTSVLLVADNRAMCEACHQKSLTGLNVTGIPAGPTPTPEP